MTYKENDYVKALKELAAGSYENFKKYTEEGKTQLACENYGIYEGLMTALYIVTGKDHYLSSDGRVLEVKKVK